MELMEIKEKVRKFMGRFFRNAEIEDDTDIFEKGFANSLFSMQLVMFIEKEFDLVIENDDLDLENFKSINAISDLIKAKM